MASTKQGSTDQEQTCPECGSGIFAHKQFRRWCPHCEWNLGVDEDTHFMNRTAKIYRKIGTAQGEKVFQSILNQDPENLRPRWTVSKVLAFAVAAAIHLVSIATAGLGIYALSFGWPAVLLMLIGILLLGLAWTMRPRLGEMPDDCLGRADAPALFALCDRIADKVGSPRADGIHIDSDYNAAFARVGLSRKTLVIIGLPMWLVQTWPERVAILAHEFSHGANGDSTRSMLVGTALDALERWMDFLRPEYQEESGLAEIIGHYLFWILSWPVELVHVGLSHLVWRQSQVAEFLADYLATTAAGTQAMTDGLQTISYDDHFSMFAHRSILSTRQSGKEVFGKFVSYFKSLPDSELERLNRLANKENASLDATHPPTRQRMEFIAAHPIGEIAITVDHAEQALIEAELEQVVERVGRKMISHWVSDR
ncbi:MAG: M48 family metallopeptidase [Gammaproteobacteria bacterium]|nr:M48 family metallopeptidase [Gammaproteobacteria bacterium]